MATSASVPPEHPLPGADLPQLLQFTDGRRVRSIEDWAERREEIRALMCRYFVGTAPQTAPGLIRASILEENPEADGSIRRRVRLCLDTPNQATFDVQVCVPGGDGPFPVFMTVPYGWWSDVALARGFLVCVFPGGDGDDATGPLVEAYPECNWSLLLRRAWLGSRALDYVLSLAEADADKVCMTGHSRNGKQTLIAAAFDERIKAVVSSSSGSPAASPYRFTSHDTFNEAPDGFVNNWFLESLRSYTGRECELPMDAHGWYALIAPRPCLISTAYNDGCEPTFAVERGYLEGREVYRLLGQSEALRIRWRAGGHHSIQEQDREMVEGYFDWFDHWFETGAGRPADFPEEFIHKFDWDAWRATLGEADSKPPGISGDRRTRVLWSLGKPPATLPWDDGVCEQARGTRDSLGLSAETGAVVGHRTFLCAEESALLDHDRWAPPHTTRVPVSFGENVHGSVYYNPDVRTPMPAVIWLHPLSYATGYNEGYGPCSWLQSPWTTAPGGVEGTTMYHRLAQAGFAVLAFDQCGFGLRLLEGRDFHQQHPHWSRLGRMVHDVGRAVDFLVHGDGEAAADLPPIDPQRVFPVGYSLGGMVGLYAAALDERITGVASFCGFSPLRTDTDTQPTGGIRRWWQWHAVQPLLGLFHGRESDIPYDFDDLLALISPRPCLVVAPTHDRTADHAAVVECVRRARVFWDRTGEASRLEFVAPEDINRLQTAQQDIALSWLRRQDETPG
jgi:dienelactone hydrolase